MGIFKKDIEDPTKPLEEPVVSEGASVPVNQDSELPKADGENQNAHDCVTCGGTGLVWHAGANRDEVCTSCAGTGKLN